MGSIYAEYLKSSDWKFLRRRALQRDGFACRVCGSTVRLEVHHRRYPAILGEESVEDLTTLCDRCHDLFSRKSRLVLFIWLIAAENLLVLWLAFRWLH